MSASSVSKRVPPPTRSPTRCGHLGPTRPLALALLTSFPSVAFAASLSIEGGAVVLGRTGSATVLVRVDDTPAATERARAPLHLSVNVGSFSDPQLVGPGLYRAVYTPPPTRFPQMALVAAWREGDPAAPVDLLRFPLYGTTRLSVKAPPGSAVSAKIGADEFGPVVADARGRAVLGVVAAPGFREATVTISRASGTVVRQVALEAPPYNRLVAAVVPGSAPAGRETPVRLEVFHGSGGRRLAPDRVHVTASRGQAVLSEATGGRYSYRYTAPAGAGAGEVRFRIEVDGEPASVASPRLALVAQAPRRLPAIPPAAPLAAPAQPAGGAIGRAAVPALRPGPSLLVGPRMGFVRGPGDMSGIRFGLDAWIPLRLGPATLGLGFSLSRGSASRTVTDSAGTLRAASSAEFFPIAARLGYELWPLGRLSLAAGAGYAAAFALFTSDFAGTETGFGGGPLAFVSASWALGPGRLFAEASASRLPIAARGFELEAGGIALEGGYRLGVF